MNLTRCQGTKKRGGPCGSFVYRQGPDGIGLCRVHWVQAYGDPDEQDALRAQQAEAGRRSSNVERARREIETAEAMTVDDALKLLGAATIRVYSGDMAPNVGSAIASMVATSIRVHQASEIESALEELERYARIR